MNKSAETIVMLGGTPGVDADGYPLPDEPDVEIPGCVVQLNVTADDIDRDRDAATQTLRVFAPAGTVIDRKRRFLVRGEVWRVVGVPHDWSTARRPVLSRHKPRVEFRLTRGEG